MQIQTMNVRGSNQAIKGLANAVGLLFNQESVAIIRVSNAYNGAGLQITHPDFADPNIKKSAYRIILGKNCLMRQFLGFT